MKNEKASVLNVVFAVVVVVAVAIIGWQQIKIKRLEQKTSTSTSYKRFPAIEIINMDNHKWDYFSINNGITLIICFKTPCTSCNQDISTFVNLKRYYGDKIQMLGIIPDGNTSGFQLQVEGKVNFPLYIPVDVQDFMAKMRFKSNVEHVILINKARVVAVKMGSLSAEDIEELRTLIDQGLQ